MNKFVKGVVEGVVYSAASFGAFYAGTLLGLKVRKISYERNLGGPVNNNGEEEFHDEFEV